MEGMCVCERRLGRAEMDVGKSRDRGSPPPTLSMFEAWVLLARILADEEQKLKGCPRTRNGIFLKVSLSLTRRFA